MHVRWLQWYICVCPVVRESHGEVRFNLSCTRYVCETVEYMHEGERVSAATHITNARMGGTCMLNAIEILVKAITQICFKTTNHDIDIHVSDQMTRVINHA